MCWVYLKERQVDEHCRSSYLYTVGFYAPDGKWVPATDYAKEHEAQEQVHYLNGGEVPV